MKKLTTINAPLNNGSNEGKTQDLMKINSIDPSSAYAPIQELTIMINNVKNSINRPINRISRKLFAINGYYWN